MGFKVLKARRTAWLSRDEGERGATLRPRRPKHRRSVTGKVYYLAHGNRCGEQFKISETTAKRLGLKSHGLVKVDLEIRREKRDDS